MCAPGGQGPGPTPRGPRRPKNVYCIATDAQRRKIDALCIDLGWSREKFRQWLSDRHHDDGRPLTSIDSSRDAQAVIELLKAVVVRASRARGRDHSGIPEPDGGDGHRPPDRCGQAWGRA